MKKISIVLAAVAAVVFASCSGNKAQQPAADEQTKQESFEEQQIKASMKARLDSCAKLLAQKPMNVLSSKDGKVVLSKQEKAVKPDYLLNPDEVMPKVETLSQKYRVLCMMDIDKVIAGLYDQKDVYTEPIQKLAAEINDPAITYMNDSAATVTYGEMLNKMYAMETEAGRENFFWAASTATIIEQLYVLGKNQDKLLANFTDDEVADLTFHISILVDNYEDLAMFDPELANLYKVICPLEKINAISVEEFRGQLNEIMAEIETARAQCLL